MPNKTTKIVILNEILHSFKFYWTNSYDIAPKKLSPRFVPTSVESIYYFFFFFFVW